MKLLSTLVLLLSLTSISFAMDQETQFELQKVKVSTKKRIDSFVEALKEIEATDDKALLNFRHNFFTTYARELATGLHAKALGEGCINFLEETITKYCGKEGASFREFYALCVFTSVMLSAETKETGDEPVLENSRKLVQQKTHNKEEFCSPQFYHSILQSLDKMIYETLGNNFITMGTQTRFYPLILIYNQFFRIEDYFYALSKRVHLLSNPYKPSTGLHGGLFSEPIEVLTHDIGHLNQFGETYSGSYCFIVFESLKSNLPYKCDMYERVGQYFFDLLQREDIDETSKKKLKEVGFNLTHENSSRKEVKFPSDKTLKSDLRYLMDCLKKSLETTFLPDCLESVEKFKSSLSDSYITYLKLKCPNDMPAKMNRNLVQITDTGRPLTFDVTYKSYQVNNVCYDYYKSQNVDWVRSAQRVGFTGKVSEDGMNYNPTAARKFHLDLLRWFETNYLSKI